MTQLHRVMCDVLRSWKQYANSQLPYEEISMTARLESSGVLISALVLLDENEPE